MTAARLRRRIVLMSLAMGGAALGARAWRPEATADAARAGLPLERLFPREVGPWQLDRAYEAFVRPADLAGRRSQMYDQVLERAYLDPREGSSIMLSVAYGRQQSVSLQLHRPDVCYVASGFEVDDRHAARLVLPTHPIPINRMRARKAGRSEPVTYWALLGDTVIADGFDFRLQQLALGLRGQILDGMVVRVSSISTDAREAWRQHERFALALVRAVPEELRARVVGMSTSKA